MQRITPYLAAACVAVLKLALPRMRPGDRRAALPGSLTPLP